MVTKVVCEEYPTKVKMVGIKDKFGESGSPNELMEKYGLTKEEMIKNIKEIL